MIPGFQISRKLHETDHSVIYRATRRMDDLPVVLKMLNSQYPTPRALARYRQEYEIVSSLDAPGVIKAYGLEKHQNTVVIVLEDFGGSSLNLHIAKQRPAIDTFLELAIQTVTALGHIYQQGIIHKDINPSNIVWNPGTNRLKIIDFGIATRFSRESPLIKPPQIIEGTIAYISPEQTGRMNRQLDYRTDFYSLGVTLYELLTGRLPFDKRDALELVHCHLAAQPRPPIELRTDTPPVLSQIIMKLLAKTVEERYQSAWGIRADLEACRAQLQAGNATYTFPLASHDASDRFDVPQKLYGRSEESQVLLEAFARVGQGRSELVLVTGYSGIGKSSLVRELYRPITEHDAFFVSGKFDLLQRATPYSAIATTFAELVKQLLTSSKEQLQHWKERLLTALGPNGRILTDVIPELELIIGAQPEIEELGPIEAQNRLHLAFCSFLRAFCGPGHPLVVFLDDLQWADAATLRLLEPLLLGGNIDHLLLIGAYRNNEVDATHPLATTLAGLAARQVAISEIHLQPLGIAEITRMLADTLHRQPATVRALAELVLGRTEGNPFFINEFLQTLHAEGLLRFDAAQPGWQWDVAEIEAQPATENVAELLTAKLHKLPEQTRSSLRLAACIGNRFDLSTIALITDQPIADTSTSLMAAARDGYIYPTSEPELVAAAGQDAQLVIREYRFAHDRVQHAAYALIPADQRKRIHLDIGRLLLAGLSPAAREERLFELVDHLNIGRPLLGTLPAHDALTPVALARLNLAAGRRAKEAAAYSAAARYLAIGIELAGHAWDEHHELALALHVEGAEVEYCHGNFDRSHALIDIALQRTSAAVVKARMYQILITLYTNQARYEDAFAAAGEALALLGQTLPRAAAATVALEQELADIRRLLGDRPIDSLIDAPEMSDETHRAAVEILGVLAPTAFQADAELFNLISARLVRLSLEHGMTVACAFGYAVFGLMLGTKFRDYRRGYELGNLALRLADRLHSATAKCKAGEVMVGHLYHWAMPLRGSSSISMEWFEAGLQSGELQFAGFILMDRLTNHFYQGNSLQHVLDESAPFLQFSQNHKNSVVTNTIEGIRIAVAHLVETAPSHTSLAEGDDAEYVARCRQETSFYALGVYYVLKCQVLYLCQEHERALAVAAEAEAMLAYIPGLISEAALTLYHCLSLTALYPAATPEQQRAYWQRLEAHQEQMRIWVQSCPENFRHMHLLIAAEMARITGDDMAAMQHYNLAIEAAEDNDFGQDLALTNELAARFWLSTGQKRYASSHLRDAHYGYARWGATRKARMLEDEHAQRFMDPLQESAPHRKSGHTSTTHNTADGLDLSSVIKASHALSSEIALDKLLARLIGIVIESAGAQHGYLILERKDRLLIEAQGTLGSSDVKVLHSLPLESDGPRPAVSTAIVHYVLRSRETVVLRDATREGPFMRDPHVVANSPKSILCMPLLNQGNVSGVVYLENNLSSEAFTPHRVELLELLSSQMAISLDNSLLYSNLQRESQDLERLLYSTAHDLKEPLRAIQSFAELLARRHGTQIDATGRDYLERIVRAGRRQSRLLDAIRTISEIRRTDAQRQRVPAERLLQEALRRLGPTIEQTRAVIDIAPDLPQLLVERRWALEAIHQLLRNALQYTREGIAPEIDIEAYDGSEGIGLVIKDRGHGLPAAYTERVFELFWRAVGHENPGTGAGLAMVRQIATKYDGSAWLRPREDGGTEAYITFGR